MTPTERFTRCAAIVVHLESGYLANPKDPGGATNMGVRLRALEDHHGPPCTWSDVKALTPDEVRAIYAETDWPGVKGDQLVAGVDLIVFDAAVNCGRGRVATFLQHTLGVTADGDLGSRTVAALAATPDLAAFVERIRAVR